MRPAFRIISLLLLLAVLAGSQFPTPAAPAPAWQSKVDAWVTSTAAEGEAEFLIYLSEQADLSGAAKLPTKLEKGRYVYEALTRMAQRTQGPVIAALQASGAEYRPYWVANVIWARGDQRLIQALAMRSDVAHLYANPWVRLDEMESASPNFSVQAPQAVEWNILKVNADDVWAAGFTGQGAVVGGQDTGYDWDHPALIRQYRGWDGSSADHNYNWHDAILSGSNPSAPPTRLFRAMTTAMARTPWAPWWAMTAPATRSAWRLGPAGSAAGIWIRAMAHRRPIPSVTSGSSHPPT